MDADLLLILCMKNGDERSVEEFVRKYYPAILRYCRLHVHDQGYAEDMTQETFARFFRTLSRYQHRGKILNYLYTIAANVCLDQLRRQQEIPMEELPEQPVYEMDSAERRMDVHRALDSLPEELREVAILYFLQGCRQREIAAILGIGLPLVKYRVRRSKELLSDYLEDLL